jgi:hypothetical protein
MPVQMGHVPLPVEEAVADITAVVEVLRGNVIPEVQVEDLHGSQGS